MPTAIVAGRRIGPYVSSVGYPDASNMPSVSGSTLTYYPNYPTNTTPSTISLTPVTASDITTPGAVVEGLDITGTTTVKAAGVTIRRCRITYPDFWAVGSFVGDYTGTGVVIQDCVIDGGNHAGTSAFESNNFTVRRCNIFGMENGAFIDGDVLIEDCFIHDTVEYQNPPDPHIDGVQLDGGAFNVTIRHNTILSKGVSGGGTNSAITMPFVSSGVATNVLATDNVLAGGGFTVYGPQSGTGSNVRITNNKFWTLYFPTVGEFAHSTDCSDEADVSGNQIGAFSGGLVSNVIVGSWSGSPLTLN